MKTKILLFVSLVLIVVQGWATEVNPSNLQFSTDVGQTATQTIRIEFADAGTPTDPNTPVVMSPSYGNPLQSIGQVSGDYSVSILGTDSQMFSAIMQNASSNACNVKVSYNPTAVGTHQAILRVCYSGAGGVSTVSVNLTGVATTTSDDPTHLGGITNPNLLGLGDGYTINPKYIIDDNLIQFPWGLIVGLTPILRFKEVSGSDSFIGVTVGSSATKTYEIRGHNFGTITEILNDFGISMKIRLSVSCTTFTPGAGGDALFEAGMFSVDPEFIDPWDIDLDEGGEIKRINLTYQPTAAGSHSYKIVASYYFCDANGFPVQDYLTFFPIIQVSGIILKSASAVERHFTATANGPLTFNDVTVGDKRTCKIHVTGTNLNGPLTVDLSPKNGMFSIDKESITANDAANGADITVTYEPTAAGSHAANIKISGGGTSETTEFDFTGNCQLPPPPTITVDQTPLNFGTINLGDDNPTKRIVVTGTNLTSDLNLSISGASHNMFTVQPHTISPADAAAGKTVVVTYKPTTVGNHTATLQISGGGIENGPIDISLSGKCLPSLEPSIEITPSTYDFGTINLGDTKTKTFTVTGSNSSERISVVNQMETTGGEYTISPTSLPASGGTVTVTFKPLSAGSSGAVFTLSNGVASCKITVEGNCASITASPSSWNFGSVAKNSNNTKKITVRGHNLTGNLTISPESSSYFSVSPTTITAAQAMSTNGVEVTVTYKPTAAGNHSATFTISGGGASESISLTGKCEFLSVNPSTYDFGNINLGDTKTKTFTVTGSNSSERISVVNQMETTGGEYTISPTSLPASGGTVTVTFKPLSAGSSGAVFTLSNGVASCKITVEGNCASITASPSSWNFGSVAKNSNNTKKITVRGHNLTGNLTISPESSSYFSVSPTTITAAQAQSANGVEVTVTYKPTAVGNHSATFTISDGVASKSISLSGKCEYLTANPSTYDFGTVVKGNQSTKTFTVTGSNSSERISVVNQMETTGGEYTISPTSLPASGGTVTVTFKPLSAGSSDAVFTLSNGVASCKITVEGNCVNPPTPEITVSTTSLVFGGYNDSRTLTVKGTNLTGSLTLTSSNSIFTVTPSTITASQAANGVTVTVKCNAATNIQHATGTLTISGGGASAKKVTLTLDATSPQPYAPSVEPEGEGDGENDGFINGELLGADGNNTASVSELEMNSKIYADRLNIIIESPIEQKAVISDIAGHTRDVNLQAGRNEIPVNASGIYIVRIREKSTKLMLK